MAKIIPFKDSKQYEKGTVKSFINWHLSRGENNSEVLKKAKEKFPRQGQRRLLEALGSVNERRKAAQALNKYKPTTNVPISRIPEATRRTTTTRVTADITFANPVLHRQQTRSHTFDVPMFTTTGELLKKLKEVLVDYYYRAYQNRVKGRSDIASRIKNIQLVAIVAID